MINRAYHNSPISFTNFDKDILTYIPFGGQNDPVNNANSEWFQITNMGDETKKPTITLKVSKAGVKIKDQTGALVDSVDIKFGETGTIWQESSVPTVVYFNKTGQSGTNLVPIANATTPGTVLANGDVKVDATGKMTVPNMLTTTGGVMASGVLDIRKQASTFPVWIRQATAASQTGVTTLGVGSEYLRLGGGEWNVGSYRTIGFGYTVNATDSPAANIGYVETSKTSYTMGDLIFATRSTTTNVPAAIRMRITSSGDIQGEGTYAPTSAQSLTTKKYVDALTALGAPAAYKASTTISTLDNQAHLITWTNKLTLTISPIATLNAAGFRLGSVFTVENYGPDGSIVQLSDACYNAFGDCKTTVMRAGESYMFIRDTNIWRSVQLRSAPPSTYQYSANATLSSLHNGDTIFGHTNAITFTVPSAVDALYFRSGECFSVESMTPTGKNVTLTLADKAYTPNSAAPGYSETNTLVLTSQQHTTLCWNATTAHWYDIRS
jgi:hypothetical protein